MKANYAFVTPTSHAGETVTRFAIVNPRTTLADITGHPRHDGLEALSRSARPEPLSLYPGQPYAGVAQPGSAPDL